MEVVMIFFWFMLPFFTYEVFGVNWMTGFVFVFSLASMFSGLGENEDDEFAF
jgi:hypothetical protein